ncbi:MAG: hypothetical protein PHH85_08970, partial [Candidatus Methanoperedens sp.]|nr:hypothetical protein [Candidatus Methanoperedens sp.]
SAMSASKRLSEFERANDPVKIVTERDKQEAERLVESVNNKILEWREIRDKAIRWVNEAKQTQDPEDIKTALSKLQATKEAKKCLRDLVFLKEDDDSLPGTYEAYLSSLEYELKQIIPKLYDLASLKIAGDKTKLQRLSEYDTSTASKKDIVPVHGKLQIGNIKVHTLAIAGDKPKLQRLARHLAKEHPSTKGKMSLQEKEDFNLYNGLSGACDDGRHDDCQNTKCECRCHEESILKTNKDKMQVFDPKRKQGRSPHRNIVRGEIFGSKIRYVDKGYTIVEVGKRKHLSLISPSKGALYTELMAFRKENPNMNFEIVRVYDPRNENLEGNVRQANINAGYIFWSELTDKQKDKLLSIGYNYDDLIGRISKDDTLSKRKDIMKLLDYTDQLYDPKKSAYQSFEAARLESYTKAYGSINAAKSAIKKAYLALKQKERDNAARLNDPAIKVTAGIPASNDPYKIVPHWYEAMVLGIKKRSDVRNPYAIVKNIWARLPAHTQRDIIAREKSGERFHYDLPLPDDRATHGTGTLRMVKPFNLAEAQVNVSKKDMKAVKKSGIFRPMKRDDGSICQVARCKGARPVNIFVDEL